jgi:hypothetical protein
VLPPKLVCADAVRESSKSGTSNDADDAPFESKELEVLVSDQHPNTGQPIGFRGDARPAKLADLVAGRYGSVERLDTAR